MPRKSSSDHEKSHGAAPAAGAPFNPDEVGGESRPAPEPLPRSVTHGLPIGEAEYRELKERAAGPRPRARKAREDTPPPTPCEDDG